MTAHNGKRCSLIALWIGCAIALWLSSYRPVGGSEVRAHALPSSLAAFGLREDHPMTDRHFELLGTRDAIWRTYVGPDGREVYVVLVMHGANWKSVHPPDICLRGSNMIITEDRQLPDAGLLTLHSRDRNQDYLSLYRYGAPTLATGRYLEGFVWHHAPRALFRASNDGYLIRVETFVEDESHAAAAARCRAFLDAATPHLNSLLVATVR